MARFADDTAPVASVISSTPAGDIAASNVQAALDELDAEKSSVVRKIRTISGAADTLVLADAGKMLLTTNAGATTITVPPNSSVAFAIGDQIDVGQTGAGQVTFAPGAGVTIKSVSSNRKISAQYAAATLVKYGTDTWWLFGMLAA